MENNACPCDSCPNKDLCGQKDLACEVYYLWVHQKDIEGAMREPAREWLVALEMADL